MFGIVVSFRRESLESKPSSQKKKKDKEEKKSEQAKTERSRLWESLTGRNESFLLNQQPPTFFVPRTGFMSDNIFINAAKEHDRAGMKTAVFSEYNV